METATTSGQLSSSTAVRTKPSRLHAIILTPAAADASVIVYDNASTNSGTILAQLDAKANAISEQLVLNVPVEANNGLYAALSGSGAKVVLHFSALY